MSNATVSDNKAELSTKIHHSRVRRLLSWPITIVLACCAWFCRLHRRKEQLLSSHGLRYSGLVFRSLCLGCAVQLVFFKIVGQSYKLDWLMSLTVSAVLLNMAFWAWMQIDLYYQAGRSLSRK